MIVAIVLAAGMSARMGKPKQTLPIGGAPMLQKVLDALRHTKVAEVVVVLGANEREVRSRVKFGKEKVVVSRDYEKGMSESLRVGLAEVGPEGEAAMVVLGDQPFLRPETVDKLIDAYANSKSQIVVPVYGGRRGNPVLFDRRLFPRVMGVKGDVGAKSVVEDNEDVLLEVPVEDRGVSVDIDTPTDYAEAVYGDEEKGTDVRPGAG